MGQVWVERTKTQPTTKLIQVRNHTCTHGGNFRSEPIRFRVPVGFVNVCVMTVFSNKLVGCRDRGRAYSSAGIRTKELSSKAKATSSGSHDTKA
jgi:hypothetical protein